MKIQLLTLSLLSFIGEGFAQSISTTQLLALDRPKATVKKLIPPGYHFYRTEENDYGYTDLYKKDATIIGYSFNFQQDVCQSVGTVIAPTSWKSVEASLAKRYKKWEGMWYANHHDPFLYYVSGDTRFAMLTAQKNTKY
jgi:hypothetical protein